MTWVNNRNREVHYFTEDGSYGIANNLVKIVTTDWTNKEGEEVEEASDSRRLLVALSIETRHKNKKDGI